MWQKHKPTITRITHNFQKFYEIFLLRISENTHSVYITILGYVYNEFFLFPFNSKWNTNALQCAQRQHLPLHDMSHESICGRKFWIASVLISCASHVNPHIMYTKFNRYNEKSGNHETRIEMIVLALKCA